MTSSKKKIEKGIFRNSGASDSDDSSSSGSWESSSEIQVPFQETGYFSFEERVRVNFDENSAFSDHGKNDKKTTNEQGTVPADQERQLLLLMLLAQVCALHDPTPRTFTVHVLELFERGILDRQSIHFLFELGLVPSISPTRLMLQANDASLQNQVSGSDQQLALLQSKETGYDNTHSNLRSVEASAIRTSLENLENLHSRKQYVRYTSSRSDPGPQSWSAEAHPLSLSRYQREFKEVGILASGAFGHVFHVISIMDGFDYAIKRIAFSARGYSKESVQQVVREVQCLAVCDHPNVVRYYTSWLEPSWMTGSGRSDDDDDDDKTEIRHNLLMGLQDVVNGKKESGSLSDDLQDYFRDQSFGRRPDRQRRFSFDSSYDASQNSWESMHEENGMGSIMTSDDDIFVRDDSFVASNVQPNRGNCPSKKKAANDYSYQICLFIQMQLCHPKTLADWIRIRNQEKRSDTVSNRIEVAAQVFGQIVAGLCHIHGKGIIHRDLKPANIFTSIEDGLTFKIGDFGLSKLIQSVSKSRSDFTSSTQRSFLMIDTDDEPQTLVEKDKLISNNLLLDWSDPHTAGVGTASYAAPEQVNSRDYGTKADMFSLGLILLELLCCFSTEHERLMTFRECRQSRILPKELSGFSVASDIILSCTDPNPDARPCASDLLGRDIRSSNFSSKSTEDLQQSEILVRTLERKLADQKKEIERCHREMENKDRIIAELSAKLNYASTGGSTQKQ